MTPAILKIDPKKRNLSLISATLQRQVDGRKGNPKVTAFISDVRDMEIKQENKVLLDKMRNIMLSKDLNKNNEYAIRNIFHRSLPKKSPSAKKYKEVSIVNQENHKRFKQFLSDEQKIDKNDYMAIGDVSFLMTEFHDSDLNQQLADHNFVASSGHSLQSYRLKGRPIAAVRTSNDKLKSPAKSKFNALN